MSNVAASGGYYISQNSDVIVSNPFTYTGSIGVVSGKLNYRKLWEEHLGITFDGVKESESSDMFSPIEGTSEDNYMRWERLVDAIYTDFKTKVVLGRNNPDIDGNNIEKIAKGRVWLGVLAEKVKLVDRLGGFTTAIKATKELLELTEKDSINLTEYPKKPSLLMRLIQRKKKTSSREDDKQPQLSLSDLPSQLVGSLGFDFMQTAIFCAIYQYLGIQMTYNPLVYQQKVKSSFHLLSPNLTMN